MLNLAIDSKLRSCDLVCLLVRDVYQGGRICTRAIMMQRKTQRPVQFEITEQTRESLAAWIDEARLLPDDSVAAQRLRSGQSAVALPYRSTAMPVASCARARFGNKAMEGGIRTSRGTTDRAIEIHRRVCDACRSSLRNRVPRGRWPCHASWRPRGHERSA